MLDKAKGLAGRPGVPRPRGRRRAARQARGAQEHRRRAERGRLGRQGPRRPGQRPDHARGPTATWSRSSRAPAPNLDCIMLPKVQTAEQVVALDLLLTQIEKTMGFEVGRIGIEAQIENALGLINVDAIAAASPRVETIIFGPADFMASHQHEVAGRRRAAARLRRRRRVPLHPDADPDGRPGARQAGHRRPVPADPRRRRLPPGRRPLGRARLRRQVGAAPRPDRRRERGVLARARRTTTTPSSSSTRTRTTPRRRAARGAR